MPLDVVAMRYAIGQLILAGALNVDALPIARWLARYLWASDEALIAKLGFDGFLE
jgi:hypothetical protein